MISKVVKNYCNTDIRFIENYEKAIKDKSQTWDCHHKLEITLNCGMKELMEKNLYLNRPATELIFLPHSEHIALHNTQRVGSKRTQEQKNLMSESRKQYYKTHEVSEEIRKKQSEANKQIIWISNDEENKRVYPYQLQHYLSIGYKLGRLPFKKPKLVGRSPGNKGKHFNKITRHYE